MTAVHVVDANDKLVLVPANVEHDPVVGGCDEPAYSEAGGKSRLLHQDAALPPSGERHEAEFCPRPLRGP